MASSRGFKSASFRFVSFGLFLVAMVGMNSGAVQAATEEFNIVAVQIGETKIWLPSTLVVHEGDQVVLHAISKIPGANNIHGLAIDAFKIQALVQDKAQDIEFVAAKEGVYPIRCHLHPTHIGGQLIVLKKEK